MSEYAISVFVILAISGILSLISYGSGAAEKTAIGIITAFVIVAPLVTAIRNIDIEDNLGFLEGNCETDADPATVAEEAFAEGIKTAVAERFLLNKENISVATVDFDMKKMRAEKIRIFLRGSAVIADIPGIESYVNSLEMGECRVEIELGKGLS